MIWLRRKLRRWLGIESIADEQSKQLSELRTVERQLERATEIGVDVHFKSPHMILIFSRFKGGQIRHIEANFDDLRELNHFVQDLKHRYGAKKEIWDMPPGIRRIYETDKMRW